MAASRVQFIIEVLDRASKQMNDFSSRFTAFTTRLTRIATAAGIAITAALSFRAFIEAGDTMIRLESQIRLVTRSTEELNDVQSRLFDVAQRTRSALAPTVELYARVARSTRELALSQRQVLDLTETVNKAIQIANSTGSEASAGVIQFAQALASGTLRGDELRSVMEQMPRLALAIVDGLEQIGVGAHLTIGDLRRLGTEGKLTAELIVKALQTQAPKIAEEFDKVKPTVSSAFDTFNNAVTDLIGNISEATGVSSSFASAITSAAGAIRDLSQAIDDTSVTQEDRIKNEIDELRNPTLFDSMKNGLRQIHNLVDLIRNPSGAKNAAMVLGLDRLTLLEMQLKEIEERAHRMEGLSEIFAPDVDQEQLAKISKFFAKWEEDANRSIDALADRFFNKFATSEQQIAKELADFRLVVKLRPEKFTPEDIARIEREIKAQKMEGLEFFDIADLQHRNKRVLDKVADDFDYVAEAGKQAARSIQQAWADFFFDPFREGLRGLLKTFIDTIRRMVAEVMAHETMRRLFGDEDDIGSKIAHLFGRAGGGPVAPFQSVRVHDGEIATFGAQGGYVTSRAAQRAMGASGAGAMIFETNIDARGADPSLIARLPKIMDQRDRALMLKVKRFVETGSVTI